MLFGAQRPVRGPLVPQRHATASLACARLRHRRRGAARGGVATIATDDRRWEPLLAAGITYAAMAAMFGDATDWSACTALLAAGGVGALVSCACAMADDEPTAEDAAAAWGAQQDPRPAATVTWDGERHPPAPTHKAAPARPAWGEDVTAPAKTAPAGAPEATATVTPAAAVPAPVVPAPLTVVPDVAADGEGLTINVTTVDDAVKGAEPISLGRVSLGELLPYSTPL